MFGNIVLAFNWQIPSGIAKVLVLLPRGIQLMRAGYWELRQA